MSFKLPLEIIYLIKSKGKIILIESGWNKKTSHYESYEKYTTKINTTSENITYLVDKKIFLCQHKKLHPLIDRRGKWISETMYRDIEKIIQHDSQKYITSEDGDDLSDHKWTNCEIEYDHFCFSYCDKSFFLDIKKKMSALEKLFSLVKILNINDDNEEKCCGVSTDFIRKLTGLFFIIIGEKSSTNIPLSKMYCLRKSATLTCLYGPMYLELDDYNPYSD